MRFIKRFTIFTLLFTLLVCPVVQAESYSHNTLRYVALGDSLTAGYEPGMSEKSTPYGFVNRVYEQSLYNGLAEVSNYGIVGLTSEGLKNFVNVANEGKEAVVTDIQDKFPDPRIDVIVQTMLNNLALIKSDIENADLVTITIGGNDFPHTIQELSVLTELERKQIIDTFAANVADTLALLTKMNPECDIYIANNYLPVPKAMGFLYPEVYESLTALTVSMAGTLEELSKQYSDVHVVDTAKSFVNNETKLTYIEKTDIHPKQAGYEAMAKSFAEAIWGSYKQPMVTEPIAVIFNGKELISHYEVLIIDNRTYVTLTDYAHALGISYSWSAKTHATTIDYGGNTVSFKNNSSEAIVNGKYVPLTGPVITKNVQNNATGKIEPKMYIPLGSLASAVNLDVKYIDQSRTAYINIK